MTRAVRSGAERWSATVFAILFVQSFDRTSATATNSSSLPRSAVDDTTVNSTAGSVVFALSIVAVLAIGVFVIWKARKNRPW